MNSNPGIHSSIIHDSIRYTTKRGARLWLRRAPSSTWYGRRSVATPSGHQQTVERLALVGTRHLAWGLFPGSFLLHVLLTDQVGLAGLSRNADVAWEAATAGCGARPGGWRRRRKGHCFSVGGDLRVGAGLDEVAEQESPTVRSRSSRSWRASVRGTPAWPGSAGTTRRLPA